MPLDRRPPPVTSPQAHVTTSRAQGPTHHRLRQSAALPLRPLSPGTILRAILTHTTLSGTAPRARAQRARAGHFHPNRHSGCSRNATRAARLPPRFPAPLRVPAQGPKQTRSLLSSPRCSHQHATLFGIKFGTLHALRVSTLSPTRLTLGDTLPQLSHLGPGSVLVRPALQLRRARAAPPGHVPGSPAYRLLVRTGQPGSAAPT